MVRTILDGQPTMTTMAMAADISCGNDCDDTDPAVSGGLGTNQVGPGAAALISLE